MRGCDAPYLIKSGRGIGRQPFPCPGTADIALSYLLLGQQQIREYAAALTGGMLSRTFFQHGMVVGYLSGGMDLEMRVDQRASGTGQMVLGDGHEHRLRIGPFDPRQVIGAIDETVAIGVRTGGTDLHMMTAVKK